MVNVLYVRTRTPHIKLPFVKGVPTFTLFMYDIVKITRSQDSIVRVATRLDSQDYESQQAKQIGSFSSQKCPD